MATFASALAELSAVAGRTLEPEAANALVRALATLYEETRDQVTKTEFAELKDSVERLVQAQEALTVELRSLAEAQRRTEERVNELAEAQRRTEERVNELAEAQRRTEERVNELAEAQRRTEERVNELAEAQRRTEERVNELTEAVKELRQELRDPAESHKRLTQSHHELAQSHHELAESHRQLAQSHRELAESHRQLAEEHRQTQHELRQLTKQVQELVRDHRRTRELLGALSDTVGYGLEDRAIRYLPRLLKKQFNLVVQGSLERRWLEYPDGRTDELNIFGVALQEGRAVTLLGEAKTLLGAAHLNKLERRLQRLEKHGILGAHRFVFVVAYSVDPKVARLAQKKNITIIPSYRLGIPW